MNTTMHLIALRQVKHSERHTILTAYSRETGRVAFAISAGGGKEAMRMRSMLHPLALTECVAHATAGREVMRMTQTRSLTPLYGIQTHPVKGSIAMFMAEVVETVTRDSGADTVLWDYLRGSIEVLESAPASHIANLHLCFLYGLGRCLGIEPDITGYHSGMIFDMADGIFRLSAPMHSHYLDPEESATVVALSRISYANMHAMKMSRSQRNRVLDMMLGYYALHHTSFASLKSLDVLRMLF